MKAALALSLLLAPFTGELAQAQTPAAARPAAARSRCDILAADYRRYEMNLADREADGIADNSAPRATMRAIEDGNDLAAAAMTVQFMRDNRCTLPSRAPTAATYFSAALACATARLQRTSGTEQPAACNRESWTRSE